MKDAEDKGILRGPEASGRKSRWIERGVLGTVCALVVGIYACTAHSGFLESSSPHAADTYYNLLVQGFRAGQLSLKKEVPTGLAQLPDPYNPAANALYRLAPYWMHDLSYYKGRLYLYFGVTPALVLFWPFVAVTGHYLFHRDAVTIFCAIGFLASVGLVHALWRRYFAEVSIGVVAACALALGLATGVPVLLSRSEVYEVSISCGYMLTMLALGAIWCALHEPERRAWWLAAAGVAYGLAVGARPSLLFGAVILLAPVIQARREQRQTWTLLIAAAGPIVLIGLGLLLYNYLRFDNPLEFGQRYQLARDRQDTLQHFSLHYLWFNFRVYFLEPARWNSRFPFISEISVPPLPAGHGPVEAPFGLLTNIPLVWLTLAVPLAWRSRSTDIRPILRLFLVAVVLLFWICALTIGLYYVACFRYEVEFAPALVLLAVTGLLGLESALAARLVWRHTLRWSWGLLLGFSAAFNLLASVEHYAEAQSTIGIAFDEAGRLQEAAEYYERALQIKPDFAVVHYRLANALFQMGKPREAISHLEQALLIKPDYAEAHNDLAVAFSQAGRIQDAIGHYQRALQIRPNYAEVHYNLGIALEQTGKAQEAVRHYEQALRLRPDYAEAHNNCGVALAQLGRVPEAISHWEQALRLRPDYAEAHYNLGAALEQTGKLPEAIEHYKQALQAKPDYVAAQNGLARLGVAQ